MFLPKIFFVTPIFVSFERRKPEISRRDNFFAASPPVRTRMDTPKSVSLIEKGGGGDESTFPNLSPLLFAFTPQPTTHHTFRRRAAASSLPLPLSLPHFQWKGLTSPFRIDGGEALGFIFLAHPHPLFQGDENDIHTEIHIRKVYRLRLPNSRQSESKFRTSGGDQRRRDLHVHVGL